MTTFKEIEDVSWEDIETKQDDIFEKNENIKQNNTSFKEKNEVKIDFLDEDFSEKISSKKILEKKEETENTDKEENKEKENKENKKQENIPLPNDSEDYNELSDFFIDIIDMGISGGLKALARDKSPFNRYSAPESKKIRLKNKLSKILAKYEMKVSIEFLFFVGLVMAYYEPAKKAINERNSNAKKEENSNENKHKQDKEQQESARPGRPRKAA